MLYYQVTNQDQQWYPWLQHGLEVTEEMADVVAIGWQVVDGVVVTDCQTEEMVVAYESIVVERQGIELQRALEFCTIGNDKGIDKRRNIHLDWL